MLFTLLLSAIGSSVSQPIPVHSNYLLTLAPEDAVAVLAIGNLDDWRSKSEKNAFCRFGRDQEMTELINYFAGEMLEQASKELNLDQLLGKEFDEAGFIASLHGSVVGFSEMIENNPDNPIIGLMLELDDDRDGFNQLLTGLLERFKNEIVISGSEHGGIQIMTVSSKSIREPLIVQIAELGNAVIVMGAQNREALEESITGIVDRWSGESSTGGLLESAGYVEARVPQDFDPQIEFHFNLSAFWDGLKQAGQFREVDLPDELIAEICEIQWLHAGARIGEGEQLDFQIGINMPSEGLLSSLRYLLGGIPIDLLKQVPRQSSRLSTINLDYQGLFNMVLDLLHTFEPDGFQKAQESLQNVAAMGIDIDGDFLSQLTGAHVRFAVEVPGSESPLGMAGAMFGAAKGDSPVASYGSATLIGLQDSTRVEAAVNKLLDRFLEQKIDTQVVEGIKIQSVNFGMASMNWAFTPHSLILSMQVTPITEAIRMLGADSISVMDKERFANPILKYRSALHFSIYETQSNLKSILAGLKSVSRMLPMISMMTGWKAPKGFPISPKTPWPSPSIVGRYFEGTIYSAVTWDDNSLRFRLSGE